VTSAKRDEIVQSVVVSGSMIARDEVMVTPEIDGFVITELLAEEGDRVAAGQVLARLSRVSLDVQRSQNDAQIQRAEAGVDQAKAQIVEAEANLVQANNAFDRTKALRDSGNASVETYDLRATAARADMAYLSQVPKYAFETALIGGVLLVGGAAYLMGGLGGATVAIGLFAVTGFRVIPALNAIQSCMASASSSES